MSEKLSVYSVLLLCLLCVPVQVLAAPDALLRQQLASLLAIIRDLYETHGFQPLWGNDAATALSVAIDSLHGDGLTPADYRFAQIDGRLRSPGAGSPAPAQAASR